MLQSDCTKELIFIIFKITPYRQSILVDLSTDWLLKVGLDRVFRID